MRVLCVICAMGLAAGSLPAVTRAQQFWGGVPFQAGAATAAESAARGVSDMVMAAGAANLMNSQAAINAEEARSKYIDNRLKGTKTYFEMKQVNKEYREANKTPRPTSEQLFRLAKDATPKQLAPDQLDPVTGQINWPEVLRANDFAACRQELEELYAQRASASGKVSLDQYKQIRQQVQEAQNLLKGKLGEIPPQVFSSANAFLRQLEHAAKLTG